MQNNNKNFQNRALEDLFTSITANMPALTFFGIIMTYLATAALSIYFIPLPLLYAAPVAILVQFGRFAVVFTDFLNPTQRSPWPPVIATGATVIALIEYGYSVQDMQLESTWTNARYWSVYLFGGMLIVFGYILELNFISKGAEGYGMQRARITPGGAQEVTQRVRNLAADATEAITPKPRPIIAGFSHNAPEAQESVETRDVGNIDGDIVREAIKKNHTSLRAYRHKLRNGIGNPETARAGIARATERIAQLENML